MVARHVSSTRPRRREERFPTAELEQSRTFGRRGLRIVRPSAIDCPRSPAYSTAQVAPVSYAAATVCSHRTVVATPPEEPRAGRGHPRDSGRVVPAGSRGVLARPSRRRRRSAGRRSFWPSCATGWHRAAGLLVAVVALYRAVLFIHEITHRAGKGPARPSPLAWNALVGVPLLIPSFLYEGVHTDHHRQSCYGTAADPGIHAVRPAAAGC